jgi:NADH-quinone oxidoreductase subunit J
VKELLFYVFGFVSLASAVLAVSRKNAVSAACWLVLMFFGLAGVYVLLDAFFVAVVQVLVYAGAIMVLFLFVIMLIDLRKDELEATAAPRLKVLGVLAALAVLGLSVCAVVFTGGGDLLGAPNGWEPAASTPDGSAGSIGGELFNTWLLAFEVTSFLLLGGILGAVLLTKRRLS